MPLFSRIHPISVKPITILRSKWLQSIPYFHQNGSKTTHTYKAQIGEYLQSPLIKCPPPLQISTPLDVESYKLRQSSSQTNMKKMVRTQCMRLEKAESTLFLLLRKRNCQKLQPVYT